MVKLKVFFHPAAMEEYVASYIWYHERGAHLAGVQSLTNRMKREGKIGKRR